MAERYCKCGNEISPTAKRCRDCYRKNTKGQLAHSCGSKKRYDKKIKNENNGS